MNTREFMQDPWGKGSIHAEYDASFLHMRPAPEHASGEVLLASTYRYVGFHPTITEGAVPSMGREFQKLLDKDKRPTGGGDGKGLDPGLWKQIVTGSLRSPKLPNQAAKRFLQISPVVPDASLYSLSARLTSNSWNPGALVARVIQFGAGDSGAANELWGQLFDSLSVNADDDVWARFLQEEFERWQPANGNVEWKNRGPIEEKGVGMAAGKWWASGTSIPANRFVRDFQRVLALKNQLTRRQWISFVEAILRLGTAADVLWVCRVNDECFNLASTALQGTPPPTLQDLQRRFGVECGFWRYGQPAASVLTSHATKFIKARAGINLLLHMLEEQFGDACPKDCLANLGSIQRWIEWLGSVRDCFDREGFWSRYRDVVESDPRLVAGRKGISANIKEFLRHVLGQRQTNEPGLDSYDQGYCLVKRAAYDKAPWVVGLGPVSVLALVHACANASCGPTTVDVFCRHLGEYGIEIETQDIPASSLGRTLRNLGLVLDSPDAEGGMVLVNPFEMMDHGVGGA